MRILTAWIWGLLLLAQPALADVPLYAPVKEKSSIKFFAIQNGAPIEGKFTDFTAEIRFDPEQLDKSSISGEVSVGSIAIASSDILDNVKRPDWLSIDKFPKATFKTKKITRMPMSDNYYADGELTLRGKTLPMQLNFQVKHLNDTALAEGSFTIRRTDFGIGQGAWAKDDVVKNEVRVEMRIFAEKKS